MSSSLPKKNYRPVHGVILLDKDSGLTSNEALIRAKRILKAKKAGHTGTLDPFATGLLPLCFGEATKFTQDLLDADKTYETTLHLGIRTSTGDIEGEIVSTRSVASVDHKAIEPVLKKFTGKIEQIPPMYSALKRDGKPLYEYARSGIELDREPRQITIHDLQLLDFSPPYLKLRVTCSKGTYIRVLGEDIGEMLGCGAHLKTLRRTKVGEMGLDKSCTLFDLEREQEKDVPESSFLKPVDFLLTSFPRLELPPELVKRFLHGQRLSIEKERLAIKNSAGRVIVYDVTTGKLLGTAVIKENRVIAPERLVTTAG